MALALALTSPLETHRQTARLARLAVVAVTRRQVVMSHRRDGVESLLLGLGQGVGVGFPETLQLKEIIYEFCHISSKSQSYHSALEVLIDPNVG